MIESSFAKLRLVQDPRVHGGELPAGRARRRDLPLRAGVRESAPQRVRRSSDLYCGSRPAAGARACCAPRMYGSSCVCTRWGRRWLRRWRLRPRPPGTAAVRCTCSARSRSVSRRCCSRWGSGSCCAGWTLRRACHRRSALPARFCSRSCCAAFAFIALRPVHIGAEAALPLSALPVAVGGVLVAFLLMVAAALRAVAAARLPGPRERGVGRQSRDRPGLPIILALLLLFDVLIGVLVFVVLVQYLAVERDRGAHRRPQQADRMTWALYTILAVPLGGDAADVASTAGVSRGPRQSSPASSRWRSRS